MFLDPQWLPCFTLIRFKRQTEHGASYLAVISAAAAVVVAAALVMVLRIFAAWRAGWRTYQSSTLPGPPLTHSVWGGCADLPGLRRGRGGGEGEGEEHMHAVSVSRACAYIGERKGSNIHSSLACIKNTPTYARYQGP